MIMNNIICEDVLTGLAKIPDESIHLVFTSPPYCVGVNYDKSQDNMKWEDYLKWLDKVWIECCRVLVFGGRLAINVDFITNKEKNSLVKEYVRPIHAELIYQMRQIKDMMFRTEICWYKQNASGPNPTWGSWASSSNPAIRRNHEYIYLWSKGSWQLKANEKPDITAKEFELWTLSSWFINPETRKMKKHPAPFPEELAKRIIKLYSFPGQNILDPFSGTGTTCKMAYLYNRNYIGIDNSQDYCDFARKRINEAGQEKQIIEFGMAEERKNRKTLRERKKEKQDQESDIFSVENGN